MGISVRQKTWILGYKTWASALWGVLGFESVTANLGRLLDYTQNEENPKLLGFSGDTVFNHII